MSTPRSFTVFGQRIKVLRYDVYRDVAYIYGWRDVVARPVTRTWIEMSPR